MNQQQKQQAQMQKVQQQENKTDFRDVATTFITEGIKAMATGGMSLGTTLQQLSLKGAMKQGIKSATKQGLRKTATKMGKVAGQAAVGTVQKLDNQDDDKMEMADIGLSLLTRGRG